MSLQFSLDSATLPTSTLAIPHSRPFFGDDLEKAAQEVSRSGMIGPGRVVERFETQMSLLHDAVGAVATSSGTAALHLALLALEVGPGDEIILPSYVCTAVLNAVRYVGATPVLADLDEDTFNLCPKDALRRRTSHTRAVIVPHMFGCPADMPAFRALEVPIIEDCAQSLGTEVGDRLAGSLGDLAVFSFYATKVITTGEGGMVIAKDPLLVERMRDLRDYDEKDDYRPRYNYHLSNLAAAIGCRQLRRLPEFIRRRRALARYFDVQMTALDLHLPKHVSGSIHYRYVVRTESSDALQEALSNAGIQAKRPVYAPLHRYVGGDFPATERVYRTALSLPLYPALTDSEAEYVVETMRRLHSDRKTTNLDRAIVTVH